VKIRKREEKVCLKRDINVLHSKDVMCERGCPLYPKKVPAEPSLIYSQRGQGPLDSHTVSLHQEGVN